MSHVEDDLGLVTFSEPEMAAMPKVYSEAYVNKLRTALGDLIDALSDEVRYEVTQSPHVVKKLDRACRLLGGAYEGYVGKWLG